MTPTSQTPVVIDRESDDVNKDPRAIRGMFDAVAPRYDLLNQLLSLGIDRSWRAAVSALLADVEDPVLDVCTGTGDVAFELIRRSPTRRCVGVDFSGEMVRHGAAKAAARNVDRLRFAIGDATGLGIRTASCGAVTIAFGIRNVASVPLALSEACRVLRPGGRIAVLEFSLPRNRLLRSAYMAYFRHVLPRVGATVSGVADAYRYLPESVLRFPQGEAFCEHLARAGFHEVSAKRLTFGIATLYAGVR